MVAISHMLMESKVASSQAPRTLDILVSGDIMQIDETNIAIKMDDTNPFESLEQNEPHSKDIEDQLKKIEEDKNLLEEEKRKIEEAEQKLLQDEMKRKVKEENKRLFKE